MKNTKQFSYRQVCSDDIFFNSDLHLPENKVNEAPDHRDDGSKRVPSHKVSLAFLTHLRLSDFFAFLTHLRLSNFFAFLTHLRLSNFFCFFNSPKTF